MCSRNPSSDIRVLIAHAPSLTKPESTCQELDGKFVHLQNPKSGSKALYMIMDGTVQEVHWFKQRYGSWFIGDSVVEDGSLNVASPVDPIFLLLPLLDKARMKRGDDAGKFRALDEVLDVDGYPSYIRLLPLLGSSLQAVCEVRELGSVKYYRLDDNKALAWLCCKVRQTSRALASLEGGPYGSLSEEDMKVHAVGVLGEYLKPDPWLQRLCTHLRVDFEAHKKARSDSHTNMFLAEPMKPVPVASNSQKGSTKKPASAAAGSRKITSFFVRPR